MRDETYGDGLMIHLIHQVGRIPQNLSSGRLFKGNGISLALSRRTGIAQ
jgi:hypothetical protein